MNSKDGTLVCVGTGMRLAGQITPIAKSHIEQADIVLAAVASPLSRQWLKDTAKSFVCLAQYYGDGSEQGKSRDETYRQMVERILQEVRSGKVVCAAFYGHPGIFACIAHRAIQAAHSEGYSAHMLPGISAEDCLVADLGMDPGASGCQSMEATQFLIYQRVIDPAAMLILWQVGLSGDLSLRRFSTDGSKLSLLVEKLSRIYPLDHQVILYEAATNPMQKTRIDKLTLAQLASTELSSITTLVLPPCEELQQDDEFMYKLSSAG